MQEKIRQILLEIVESHGKEIFTHKGRIKGLLLDKTGTQTKETRAIIECINQGLAEEIVTSQNDQIASKIHLWKHRLVEDLGFQESLAIWAIECLLQASGNNNFPKLTVKKPVGENEITTKDNAVSKYGTFTDPRDGKVYKTVKIVNQVWMAENLNYEIKNSWCYDNNPENAKKYGRLYDWETAKRVAPPGWHLPFKEEFEILLRNLGGEGEYAYKQLIAGGASGFEALFGGFRNYSGSYDNMGFYAYFCSYSEYGWSHTEYGHSNACSLHLDSNNQKANLSIDYSFYGFSVRCIKD